MIVWLYYKAVNYYMKPYTEGGESKEQFKITRNSETSKIDSHWTDAALLRPGKTASLDKKVNPVTVQKIPDDISWWSWKGGPPTRK